jgi:DNA-binding transcriptional LysR family regulator
VFPRVEVRHLHAVIVLAEELNFTRAADRLRITQSGFSKQINEVEALYRFHLFIRTNKKNVELTEVGRIFVEEARLALWHMDRAVHAAREGSDSILNHWALARRRPRLDFQHPRNPSAHVPSTPHSAH